MAGLFLIDIQHRGCRPEWGACPQAGDRPGNKALRV